MARHGAVDRVVHASNEDVHRFSTVVAVRADVLCRSHERVARNEAGDDDLWIAGVEAWVSSSAEPLHDRFAVGLLRS